jgi:CobQ-like glutamine amidotransferase family enzyme
VVVGENEEDIRPLGRLGLGRGRQAENQAKRYQRHSFFNHVFHGKINLPAKPLNPVLVKAAL